MSAAVVAQTIQFVLAPVVMITSCAIILSGILTRYGAVNDRMRAMTRERLDLLVSAANTPNPPALLVVERLDEIDRQLPKLLRRHALIRNSAFVIYLAVLVFVVSMFAIGLAVLEGSTWIATAALALFLGGTALLLAGLLVTAIEVRNSHDAVDYEVNRVLALPRPDRRDATLTHE